MAKKQQIDPDFVNGFRQSLPYIHAHRGTVVVLSFSGEALTDNGFANLIHDIALLHGLGIKLVLVPGARPQIEERLNQRGAGMQVVNGLRVTDAAALDCVKEANGAVRVEIEALLSMGASSSLMAGACIRVASGNYVTAKPIGVIDGVDYNHTGEVRRVDGEAIQQQLDSGSIVLLPALGYSPTGEIFNLNAADVAGNVAATLSANKLIFLGEGSISDSRGRLITSMAPSDVDRMLARRKRLPEEQSRILHNAAAACRGGVRRAHILDRRINGILLAELFTRDGAGTLVTNQPYESIRTASIDDVVGIMELITPLEQAGVLVKRSRELLEQEIGRFSVIERDGTIIACAALYPFVPEKLGELACLVVHPDYRNDGHGDSMLQYIQQQAQTQGLENLFVLSTRTSQWFKERGFQSAQIQRLPKRKRNLYNWQRNSRAFIKTL